MIMKKDKSNVEKQFEQALFKNMFWGMLLFFSIYNVVYFMYLFNFVAPRNTGLGFMIFTNSAIMGVFIHKYISLWKKHRR